MLINGIEAAPYLLLAGIVVAFVFTVRTQLRRTRAFNIAAVEKIGGEASTDLWTKAGAATGRYRGRIFGIHLGQVSRFAMIRTVFVATDSPVARFAGRYELRGFHETPYGKRVRTADRKLVLTSDEPDAVERVLAAGLADRLGRFFAEPSVSDVISIATHDARRARLRFATYRGSEAGLLIVSRGFRRRADSDGIDPRLDLEALLDLEKTLQAAPVGDAERAPIPAPSVLFVSSVLRIVLGVILALGAIAGGLWLLMTIVR